MKSSISLMIVVVAALGAVSAEDAILSVLVTGEDFETVDNGTNTTTAPMATTRAPTPSSGGAWHFDYQGTNHSCIMMQAGNIGLEITYKTKNGSQKTLALNASIDNTTVVQDMSVCGNNLSSGELNETLALNVRVTSNVPYSILLQLFFTRDPIVTRDRTLDKSQLFKISAAYTYDPAVFSDIAPSEIGKTVSAATNRTLNEFSVLKDRSYQCVSPSTIKIDDKVTLNLKGVRSQAFLSHDYFSTAEPCSADAKSSDLIPIVIGSVLAAIVLIVLVAYLIGRARRRRNTYESI